MPKQDDFSWDTGKVKNGSTLGKIVTIPKQDEKLKASGEFKSGSGTQEDIVVDEFKEKMAEVLSRELRKK